MAGNRWPNKRRIEPTLFAEYKTLAKRGGELSAWPNVPSSVLRAHQEKRSALPQIESAPLSARFLQLERAALLRAAAHYAYRLGSLIARRQRRLAHDTDSRRAIAEGLAERSRYRHSLGLLSPLSSRRFDEAFVDGVLDGLQQRIRTEDAAFELSKALGGKLKLSAARRALSDPRRFARILQSMEAGERDAVMSAFHDRYGSSLADQIRRSFVGTRRAAALKALTENNDALDFPSWRGRLNPGLVSRWRGRVVNVSSEQLKMLDNARRSRGQGDLASFIRSRIREVGIRDLLLARLAEDRDRALAAEMRCGLEGLPEFWPGRYFAGEPLTRRQWLLENYRRYYPATEFTEEVERRMSYRERALVRALVDRGVVSAAELCYLSMAGFGTDERTLVALFSALTKKEIDVVECEFPEIWRANAPRIERPFPLLLGTLRSRLRVECGGDTWLDLSCYLDDENLPSAGEPAALSLAELQRRHQILTRTYNHERSGRAFRALSFFSAETDCMDEDCGTLSASWPLDADAGEAERIRLAALLAFAETACHNCRELKHFVGNLVTNVIAAATVFCSLVAVSLLGLPLLEVMAIIALVSGATRIGLKNALKGRGYHREEFVGDLLYGAVDGLTLFASRFLRQLVVRSGTSFAAKLGFRAGAKRYVTTLNLPGLARSGFDVRRLIGKRVKRLTPAYLRLNGQIPAEQWLALEEPAEREARS